MQHSTHPHSARTGWHVEVHPAASSSVDRLRGPSLAARRVLPRAAPPSARPLVACSSSGASSGITDVDLSHLLQAAQLADSSAGVTAPHPNAACVLVDAQGRTLASAYQRAQGTTSAEVQAVQQARDAAAGATAYLNLESGDCHGDRAALDALLGGRVARVVVGLRHPLQHLRGRAIAALRSQGVVVDVLRQTVCQASADAEAQAARACMDVNDALLHRAVLRRPLSTLKYAMTLDGKIATNQGHSAWVSSAASRAIVFETRARSDAVIVGGNTVRRDNPRLTTRREGGHLPARVVMSRTLELPEAAELWDVSVAPTIVLTQRGARRGFQTALRRRGVEVVEFDFLTPEGVADYCYERGFLQCLWECGGTLAAPCISSGVIHRVMAFVAPKIIGGARAPTPVGELGFVEMTQAVDVLEPRWQQVGPDMLIRGYLPASGGPLFLEDALTAPLLPSGPLLGGTAGGTASSSGAGLPVGAAAAVASPSSNSTSGQASSSAAAGGSVAAMGPFSPVPRLPAGTVAKLRMRALRRVAPFYKAWDMWGALSNFSPHPIVLPRSGSSGSSSSGGASTSGRGSADVREWSSVEHYYQSQKFTGVSHPDASALAEAVAAAASPEEAARIGRRAQHLQPGLIRQDWPTARLDVMLTALRAKFSQHSGPRHMLLGTAGVGPGAAATEGFEGETSVLQQPYELVEASPVDFFWGSGYDDTGTNHLGRQLMLVRSELLSGQLPVVPSGAAGAAAAPTLQTAGGPTP